VFRDAGPHILERTRWAVTIQVYRPTGQPQYATATADARLALCAGEREAFPTVVPASARLLAL
jgi:hypothetical protein